MIGPIYAEPQNQSNNPATSDDGYSQYKQTPNQLVSRHPSLDHHINSYIFPFVLPSIELQTIQMFLSQNSL